VGVSREREYVLTHRERNSIIDNAENANVEKNKKNWINRFFTCSKFLSKNEIKLQHTPKDFHAGKEDDKDSNSVNFETSAEVQSLDENIDISSSNKSSDAQSSNKKKIRYDFKSYSEWR